MRMKSRVKAKKEAPKENKIIENAVTCGYHLIYNFIQQYLYSCSAQVHIQLEACCSGGNLSSGTN